MKKLLFFILSLIPFIVLSQANGYLRYDKLNVGNANRTSQILVNTTPTTSGGSIYFFGNSESVGYGLADATYGWTNLVANRLGMTRVNQAVAGSTLSVIPGWGTTNMFALLDNIPVKLSTDKYLVICYDVNDLRWKKPGYDTAFNRVSWNKIMDTCAVRGWTGKTIVLVTPFYFANSIFAQDYIDLSLPVQATQQDIINFGNVVKSIASQRGTHIVDAYTSMVNNGSGLLLLSDSLHANLYGNKLIANLVMSIIDTVRQYSNSTIQKLAVNGLADFSKVRLNNLPLSGPKFIPLVLDSNGYIASRVNGFLLNQFELPAVSPNNVSQGGNVNVGGKGIFGGSDYNSHTQYLLAPSAWLPNIESGAIGQKTNSEFQIYINNLPEARWFPDHSFEGGLINGPASTQGANSFLFGLATECTGPYSVALGALSRVFLAADAMAVNAARTYGFNSFAANSSRVYNDYGTAFGPGSFSVGINATSFGGYAFGDYSTTFGEATNQARGTYSTAYGIGTRAKPYASFVIGAYNDTTGSTNNSNVSGDKVFEIGFGASNASRLTTLYITNGGSVNAADRSGYNSAFTLASMSGNQWITKTQASIYMPYSDSVAMLANYQSTLLLKIPFTYLDTDGTLSANSDLKIATQKATKTAITDALVNFLDDRGLYNASGNVFPSTGGSGSGGAVDKGDLWTISVAGTLGGTAVAINDQVRALVNVPGQTAGNWAISPAAFGFTPENVANKVNSISASSVNYTTPTAVINYFTAANLTGLDATHRWWTDALATTLTGKQAGHQNLTDISAATFSNGDFAVKIGGVITNRTVSNVRSDLSINNLDNTSDANKPVSTAQQTALNLKSNLTSPVFLASMAYAITTLNTNTTLDATHHTILGDAASGSIVLTLPTAASSTGRVYNIKKINSNANTVTIDPNGAELIDGVATKVLSTQYQGVSIQSNGTSWFINLDNTIASGGSGTVTDFSAGDLTNFFTTTEATTTTTPALTFTIANAAAHTFWGNNTAGTAAPSYQAITAADLPTIPQSGITNLTSDLALLAPKISPSLTTPSLGVATATSINGNTFTTGTYTLTGVAGKTLTFNKSITLEGTDATVMTFPSTSATIARTDAANTFVGLQTMTTPSFTTGFTIGGAAASGKFIVGNGTNYVASTSTIPTSAGATANKVLLSNGTDYVLSTPTFPNASATSGKTIRSDGTNWIASTATLSDAPSTANKWLRSDGTNWITSTSTLSDAPSTASKWLRSDGTNWITSTSTLSDAPSTAGKILISDGTNWITSTPTYPNATGTVGQYAMSDGTNMVYTNNGGASIVTASSAINTTETLILKTGALAANRLLAGTTVRVTLIGTCTSTAANVSTFRIRIGTAGTTSDGVMQAAASSVAATSGTNVPFRMVFEFTVRTTGASATSHGFCTLLNTGILGISANQSQVILPTFTNFNTTTASNIISCTYQSAASTTTSTFQDAVIEIIYQ